MPQKAPVRNEKFTGFKVVEGRSNRKYTDEPVVAKAEKMPATNLMRKKLLGITDMSQALAGRSLKSCSAALPTNRPANLYLCRRAISAGHEHSH